MPEERLAFSFALLADAEQHSRPLTGCPHGHLVIAGNSHWQPLSVDETVRTLTCELVPDCTGGTP
jgi:hypothetical protein